jgi:hypothetical protein
MARDWIRKVFRVRVVWHGVVVGYVSIWEHQPCRAFTAVPVL